MAYIKTTWTDTTLRSARAMNHMEAQWTAIQSDADSHDHDDRYYTKTLADTTFYSTSYYTGFDADLLDGSHLDDIIGAVMPIGAIMIWSGSDGDVPTGWYVCDGNAHNGYTTPNLVERFVIGAGGSYSPGDTGGPATWNGTITPTGTVAIGNHILTTSEIPSHTHEYTEYYNPSNDCSNSGPYSPRTDHADARTAGNQDTGGSAHGHTGSTISINAIDPRPRYYSLYYIMKCV